MKDGFLVKDLNAKTCRSSSSSLLPRRKVPTRAMVERSYIEEAEGEADSI